MEMPYNDSQSVGLANEKCQGKFLTQNMQDLNGSNLPILRGLAGGRFLFTRAISPLLLDTLSECFCSSSLVQ